MGGKNAAIVLPDADFDKAIYDVLFSAFVSAGQRCTAASRAIVVGDARRFARRIAQLAARLTIGHPLDDGVFMGPLASPGAVQKFEAGAAASGEEVVLASRRVKPRGLDGCYLTPSVHFVQNSRNTPYQREELFGPDLAVYAAASEEEALAIANATDYGLAASVHTQSESAFDRCQRALDCGVVNWNAPTVGASGRLPFGGLKRSGNHRPAALFSTLYCAAPVAVMRGAASLDKTKLAPGVAWVNE
jgi:succinylglutamic semialdehyde dehydrogenase